MKSNVLKFIALAFAIVALFTSCSSSYNGVTSYHRKPAHSGGFMGCPSMAFTR